jgi:hypothetical protein
LVGFAKFDVGVVIQRRNEQLALVAEHAVQACLAHARAFGQVCQRGGFVTFAPERFHRCGEHLLLVEFARSADRSACECFYHFRINLLPNGYKYSAILLNCKPLGLKLFSARSEWSAKPNHSLTLFACLGIRPGFSGNNGPQLFLNVISSRGLKFSVIALVNRGLYRIWPPFVAEGDKSCFAECRLQRMRQIGVDSRPQLEQPGSGHNALADDSQQ